MKEIKDENNPYETKYLPIEDVVPDPLQPRDLIDDDKIKALAESIEKHGLLQPILVRPSKNGKYQIVHGERRYRACVFLHKKTIRTEIRRLDDDAVLEDQIVENLQREDLNPIEEAKAFQRMQDELEYIHEKIGERIGKSREYVTNKLRLLSLPDDIQRGVARGKISEGHAKALLSLKDVEIQRRVCKRISSEKLNVRKTEQMIQNLTGKNVPHETSETSCHTKTLLIPIYAEAFTVIQRLAKKMKTKPEDLIESAIDFFESYHENPKNPKEGLK